MRRELTDQAEAMARQRVQHLGEELRSAGLLPPEPEDDDPVQATVVRSPGRHARSRVGLSGLARITDGLSERLPFAVSHLTVLIGIAAVVLIGIAWLRISASSAAVAVPRARTAQPLPSVSAGVSGPASPAASTGTEVVVDVAGKVRHPGVITLPQGSRVIDAIKRAGGARHGVDLGTLNLARVLVDGEQILVGVGAPQAAASPGVAAGPGGDSASGSSPVSLNQATLEQLESLPGVGPVTAQKILDYRTAHGPFSSVDQLLDVQGIGEKTLAELAPHLTP